MSGDSGYLGRRMVELSRQRQRREFRIGAVVGAVCLIVAIIPFWEGGEWRKTAYIVIAIGIFSLLSSFRTWRKLVKSHAETAPTPTTDEHSVSSALLNVRHLSAKASEEDRFLCSTPPPRSVSLTLRGKVWAVLCFTLFGGLGVWTAQQFIAKPQLVILFAALFMLGLLASFFTGLWRDRSLLSEGEATLGLVIDTRLVSSRYYSYTQIQYDFVDSQQNTRTGKSADYSSKIPLGAAVAIFYDLQNPNKSSARCGSYYEVEKTYPS